jgi:hypothetical protein
LESAWGHERRVDGADVAQAPARGAHAGGPPKEHARRQQRCEAREVDSGLGLPRPCQYTALLRLQWKHVPRLHEIAGDGT